MTSLTVTQIERALAHCSGTEPGGYLRHKPFGGRGIVLAQGARFLAERVGAWWLMDAILSHQPEARKDEMLRDFQIWRLRVKDKAAVLTCERDTDDVAITQEIPYTDFPLDEVKLYLELGSADGVNPDYVLMLPSER
jgi:hypothetical protein